MCMYIAPAVVCGSCRATTPKGMMRQIYNLRCKVVELEHKFLHLENTLKALEEDLTPVDEE